MRRKNARNECIDERDEDLMRAYREAVGALLSCDGSHRGDVGVEDVFKAMVERPARRFWVSEHRAAVVVGAMRCKGYSALRGMNRERREMYGEIYRRYIALMAEQPSLTLLQAVAIVVRQPAPRFYITASSGKVAYYRSRFKYRKR